LYLARHDMGCPLKGQVERPVTRRLKGRDEAIGATKDPC
jgi:ribosomal protein S13